MKKQRKVCPICGSKKLTILYKDLRDMEFNVEGKFTLAKCIGCKTEFVTEILSESELGKYYPATEYYSFSNTNPLNVKYHEISAYYFSQKNKFLNGLLRPIEPLLYRYYLKEKGKSVLEIGCGNGLKLNIYKKNGQKTRGIEPYGPTLTKEEKELGITRETIENAKFANQKFDVIILKEVLEHVPDQEKVLSKCREWLKEEGVLIITVQTTTGLWKKVFGKNWIGYDVPRHVYNYDPKNIEISLNKNGLKKRSIRTYDNPYMLVGSLKYKFDQKNKKINKLIFSNLSMLIATPISLIVSYFGGGSLMEIEATKERNVNNQKEITN